MTKTVTLLMVGNFNFLFGSPESLAGDSRFRDMFSQDFYRRNTVAIVCDEVHTVVDLQVHVCNNSGLKFSPSSRSGQNLQFHRNIAFYVDTAFSCTV